MLPGATSWSPRSTSSVDSPARFTPTRAGAMHSSRWLPWTSMPRTRVALPAGSTTNSCPTRSLPRVSEPVITVPKPFIVKTRSTWTRVGPAMSRGETPRATRSMSVMSSSKPAPVRAEVATIGAPSNAVPSRASAMSSCTSSSVSASTRSDLVRTTIPASISRVSRIVRCSRVWGMTPSSAATTSRNRSMPVAPASIFFTKRSWPGTSTIPACAPEGRSNHAKPRSMVRPRSCSSLRRSVLMPVRRWIRAVLP